MPRALIEESQLDYHREIGLIRRWVVNGYGGPCQGNLEYITVMIKIGPITNKPFDNITWTTRLIPSLSKTPYQF